MHRTRWIALAMVVGLLITTLAAAPGAAYASTKGRKNTAMLLGAAAVYSLLTRKTTQGLILGAGAYYAYTRYQAAHRREKARNRIASYRTARYRSHRRHR